MEDRDWFRSAESGETRKSANRRIWMTRFTTEKGSHRRSSDRGTFLSKSSRKVEGGEQQQGRTFDDREESEIARVSTIREPLPLVSQAGHSLLNRVTHLELAVAAVRVSG